MARQKIISRDEAKASGLKRYFTNIPCKRGHIAERQVSNKTCLACFNEYEKANRHKSRERLNRWRDENRKHVRVRDNKYRAKNAEAAREKYQRWYKSERGYLVAMANKHRHRFRKNGNGGVVTADELLQILRNQMHQCAYCGIKLTNQNIELDHIMPAKLGGKNIKKNVHFVCKRCSRDKGQQHPEDFLNGISQSDAS